MSGNVPAGRPLTEPDIGDHCVDVSGTHVERSHCVCAILRAHSFETRIGQRAFDIHPDERLIFDKQN